MQKLPLRHILNLFVVLIIIFGLGLQAKPVSALGDANLVVNSNYDLARTDFTNPTVCETSAGSGVCTLRAAIQTLNAFNPKIPVQITFRISKSNPDKPIIINVASQLPVINAPDTTIQGPNLHDMSEVVLRGNNQLYPGIEIQANRCAVKYMVISGFAGDGILVRAPDSSFVDYSLIYGNKIGNMVPGAASPYPNGNGIRLVNARWTTIGGELMNERNIIAGNDDSGIYIQSGNENIVKGNLIGINSDDSALPNQTGIYISSASSGNTIGGSTANSRNIISGNTSHGIYVVGNSNVVKGNYIGTNAAGNSAVPNGQSGIHIGEFPASSSSGNIIGGALQYERNLISGNSGPGICLINNDNTSIKGNLIGLNADQNAALPNYNGIEALYSINTQIGSAVSGEGNIISGNNLNGIIVGTVSNNVSIKGNLIGVNNIVEHFGNTKHGIKTDNSSSTIGGTELLARNIIAYNGEDGIEIGSLSTKLIRNSIYNNGHLGIDVRPIPEYEGVTPNDPGETDNIQDFPVLTSIEPYSSTRTEVEGYVNGLPNETIDVSIFGGESCDPTGYGEGGNHLATLSVTTDNSGVFWFELDLGPNSTFKYYTATAYSTTRYQSEFSACVSANTAPVLGSIGNKSIDELATLSFTATAEDADLPAQTLKFTLVDAPTGAEITLADLFTWAPTEEQGPNDYTFDVCVTDGVTSTCETITVTVSELNVAPVLGAIGNKSVDELATLKFTATATDTDLPVQTLSYSLIGLTPPGAAINASTGGFTWTPTEEQGPSVFAFDLCVSDGDLTDCEWITVTVNEVELPTFPIFLPLIIR